MRARRSFLFSTEPVMAKLKAQLAFHSAHPESAFLFTDYLQVSQEGEGRGTCFEQLECPIRLRNTTDYLRLDDELNSYARIYFNARSSKPGLLAQCEEK
jgi:hypothetical protein